MKNAHIHKYKCLTGARLLTTVLIAASALLTITSCGGKRQYDTQLDTVDSLIAAGSYEEAKTYSDSLSVHSEALSHSQLMRFNLLLADVANQLYEPMPSDSIMTLVTNYYDRHGSANERMRAYYLRGYAAHTRGEDPFALEMYNTAIEQADTTSSDCDYRRMAIICSQASEIFSKQYLLKLSIEKLRLGEKYALRAGDTEMAILLYLHTATDYEMLGNIDSALYVSLTSFQRYSKAGLEQDAAIGAIETASLLMSKNKYNDAAKYIDIYEKKSGLFDEDGNIQPGYEMYYYTKGLYLIGTGRYTEAEKVLKKNFNTQDLDEKEGYSRGLSKMYELTGKPDSALRYARIAQKASDDKFRTRSSERISNMIAEYNYNRYKNDAIKKTIEALELRTTNIVLFAILLFAALFGIYLHRRHKVKQEQEKEEYKRTAKRIEEEQEELRLIQQKKFAKIEEEKDKNIREMQVLLSTYRLKRANKRSHKCDEDKWKEIKKSDLYKSLVCIAQKPTAKVSEDIMNELVETIDNNIPRFRKKIVDCCPDINKIEYNVCMLVRIGFKPGDISRILRISPSTISKMRTSLLQRLFHKNGRGKDFDKLMTDF